MCFALASKGPAVEILLVPEATCGRGMFASPGDGVGSGSI